MFKKLLISILILNSLLIGAVMVPQVASAAACTNSTSLLGIPSWYKYLVVGQDPETGKCGVIGPTINRDGKQVFDWQAAISRVALAVVDILLRIGALVSIGFIIYGGFRYILSQGEPDSTKKARGTILNAIIGLVITMLSTVIVSFVGNVLWK